jgi:hypothetical protein
MGRREGGRKDGQKGRGQGRWAEGNGGRKDGQKGTAVGKMGRREGGREDGQEDQGKKSLVAKCPGGSGGKVG